MTRKPRKVSRLLHDSPDLDHFLRMLAQQETLLSRIRSQLPDSLAPHCLHARIRDRELVLHVDSPAWHSRMRFHAPALLRALRPVAPGLKGVRIRVLAPQAAPSPPPAAPERRGHRIPLEAITDPELKKLLEG